uniref:Uncharacterized protein n=1 Tax=Brassica campestris TaxID=3711 RepID=M4FFJ3_BRACM
MPSDTTTTTRKLIPHFITELGSCLFFCRRHAVNGLRCFMVMLDFLLQICQMKRLKSFTSSKYGDVRKNETVTLAELNNYVLNSPPQSGGPNNTSSSNFCSQEISDAQEDPLHLRDPTQEFMSYKQRLRSH